MQRRWRWGALVVASIVAIAAVAQPLVRSADATRAVLARDAIALADARATVAEIASLARGSAPAMPDAKSELERVLVQTGLRPAVTQLDWQDGRARLTFAAVGFDALVRALETLQREARLRVIDAKLTARVDAGTVRAELTLGR
jgi:type II secretory pathway component PulM